MHASTTIELNPQFLACAMPHARSWCLFVCRLCTLPGKEGPGSTTPVPPGCGQLNASRGVARVQILFEPRASKSCLTSSERLGCTTEAPPVCRLEVGSGTRELAKLFANKAGVVIGVLGGYAMG